MALLLAVLTTCIFILSAEAKPPQPELNTRQTEDMHILCNMDHFDPDEPPFKVDAFEIYVDDDEGDNDEKKLATLDSSRGPQASSFLANSRSDDMYWVTGSAASGQEMHWWLKVFLGQVEPKDYGAYWCNILYRTYEQQGEPTVWTSQVIKYIPKSRSGNKTVGFTMSLEKRLDLLCEYDIADNDAVSKMSIKPLSSGTTELAVWPKDHANAEYCHSRVLCSPRKVVGQYTSLDVQILNLTCDDAAVYECLVETERSGAVRSEQKFTMTECSDAEKTTENVTLDLAEDSKKSTAQETSTTIGIVFGALSGGATLVLIILGICYLRFRHQGSYSLLATNNQSDRNAAWSSLSKNHNSGYDNAVQHLTADREDNTSPASSPPLTPRVDFEVHGPPQFIVPDQQMPSSGEAPDKLSAQEESSTIFSSDSLDPDGPQTDSDPQAKAELPATEDDHASNREVNEDLRLSHVNDAADADLSQA